MAAYQGPTNKTPMLERSSRASWQPYPAASPLAASTDSKRSSIVVNQPLAITEKHYHSSMINDHYLFVSITLCMFSLLCGCWTIILSIPAIYYSIKARKAFKNSEYREMLEYEKISFAFNIGVVVCWLISITIVIGVTYRELCGPTGIFCNTAPRPSE